MADRDVLVQGRVSAVARELFAVAEGLKLEAVDVPVRPLPT